MRRGKYNAKPITIDGIRFPSTKQGKRYQELKLEQAAGEIEDLRVEVSYPIVIGTLKVCVYRADHVYRRVKDGSLIVEDSKGVKTAIYNLKKKLMKAVYGIEILET